MSGCKAAAISKCRVGVSRSPFSSQIGAGAFKRGSGGDFDCEGPQSLCSQVEPQQMVEMPAACLLRLKVPETAGDLTIEARRYCRDGA